MNESGLKREVAAYSNGLLGVLIFSGSLPATRVAVADFSPLFMTSARAVIAALLGSIFLFLWRSQKPERQDLLPLSIVAIGVVIGFPFLTALALQHVTAAHSLVFAGLLPLSTAIFGVLRGGERPKSAFWLFSVAGAFTVIGFALYRSDGGTMSGDLLMLVAILLCGLGYAEGALLSRRLGGWQVITWALLLALPMMSGVALLTTPGNLENITSPAWLGLAYVSIFSMLIGFVFWYRGLSLGGIANVGQLQLLQPFFGLILASLLLGEPVAWTMIALAAVVVLCVAGAKRFS
jgi:drug/metabolite transporter (DMT)-like permease